MKLKILVSTFALALVVFVAGCKKDEVAVLSPIVTSSDPVQNAASIERNKVVSITFKDAMNPLSINENTFTLYQGATKVAGSITYAEKVARFTPTTSLAAKTIYTATITTGVLTAAGVAQKADIVWTFTTGGSTSSLEALNLGSASNYVILAKTAITNISTSVVKGDLGLSPAATSYITGFALTNATGFATSAQVAGQLFAADMAAPTPANLTTAIANMITAYNSAASRTLPDFIELGTGNIGGKTLVAGLYKWSSNVTIPSAITISGSANDIWIFQIAGNLTMGSAVAVTLTGGAQAKNVFWQVAGEATFGTTSHMEGIVLCKTGITFQTGASINGRALAQTAVALDTNKVGM